MGETFCLSFQSLDIAQNICILLLFTEIVNGTNRHRLHESGQTLLQDLAPLLESCHLFGRYFTLTLDIHCITMINLWLVTTTATGCIHPQRSMKKNTLQLSQPGLIGLLDSLRILLPHLKLVSRMISFLLNLFDKHIHL